jgi:hypothetical protein
MVTASYVSDRRPVGDLPRFGFFRLQCGVSRLTVRIFLATRGLPRRTRHCRRTAGAQYVMCELERHGTAGARCGMCELAWHDTAGARCGTCELAWHGTAGARCGMCKLAWHGTAGARCGMCDRLYRTKRAAVRWPVYFSQYSKQVEFWTTAKAAFNYRRSRSWFLFYSVQELVEARTAVTESYSGRSVNLNTNVHVV